MKVSRNINIIIVILLTIGGFNALQSGSHACTAISLKAEDGDILFGRTMEWGSFDLNGEIMLIPKGYKFTGNTPDNKPGFEWRGKYGVAGISMLGKDVLSDGINEKGMILALLYHPGFAEYSDYDPAKADKSMGPLDISQYLLTTCATVADVREAMKKILVVPVVEPAIGITPPTHFMIVDAAGDQIVIEFQKGEVKIYDAPLGVITNAPFYDWHITNLRNYIFLSPKPMPDEKIAGLDFTPLGGGSGMIGLPGDFTPPSRFVRAVAFTSTARKTADGPETVYEMFRILDNFNVPLGAAEGSDQKKNLSGMRSSTIWTVVYDTRNLVLYYHTQNNRRVRQVDLKKIDFDSFQDIVRNPLDKVKSQDIEDVTPVNF